MRDYRGTIPEQTFQPGWNFAPSIMVRPAWQRMVSCRLGLCQRTCHNVVPNRRCQGLVHHLSSVSSKEYMTQSEFS